MNSRMNKLSSGLLVLVSAAAMVCIAIAVSLSVSSEAIGSAEIDKNGQGKTSGISIDQPTRSLLSLKRTNAELLTQDSKEDSSSSPIFSERGSKEGGDIPRGTSNQVQDEPRASISCEVPENPEAHLDIEVKIIITNHSLPSDTGVFVRFIYSWEHFSEDRKEDSEKLELGSGESEYEGTIYTRLPGENYRLVCELYKAQYIFDTRVPLTEEKLDSEEQVFDVTDFEWSSIDATVKITACNALTQPSEEGYRVSLKTLGLKDSGGKNLVVGLYMEVLRDGELVHQYPAPGKELRQWVIKNDTIRHRSPTIESTFTTSEPGEYTLYCHAVSGPTLGTAQRKREDFTLEDYYAVFTLIVPVPAFTSAATSWLPHDPRKYWVERIFESFSTTEAITAQRFCVGDEENCQDETEGDPAPEPAGCTRDIGTWTGTVSVSGLWSEDCESEAGSGKYARYYTFSLDEESELAVTLESSEADPYLYLRSGDATSGSTLADNDDVDPDGGNTNSEIVRTLDAGTYTIEATTSNEGETGRFTLTLSEPETATTPPLAGNCVQTVSASETVTDQWASGCASETRSGRYARFYTFALDQESEVAITLESSDADTYLYLRSGSETTGSVLYVNDNHEGSTSRSQIQETLSAGTYTIEATTYDPGITGSFTLTISGLEATTQPPTTPEVVCFQDLGVLIETTTVAEAWTGECPSPHWYGRYARHYTFTLLRELELRVGLISTEDAFLFLLHGADPDGALVAGNDDVSSGNTNSYLARTLAAGTYTIEATTRDEGIVGNFTLTIDPRDIPTIPTPPRPTPPSPSAAFDRNAAGDFPGLAGTGNDLPVGIWSDWETVWVADETDDKLYAYDMKTKARVAGKDFDTLAAVGNNHLAGVWSDSDTMWVADYIDARVYAYHAESKARHIAEEFGGLKSAGNANPTGIWSDGATMWVADNVDKKIYAYNMRTKARAPEKEINTLNAAGNHHPRGLWSNGKTLWVADDSDDKVYAYDLTTKAQVPGKDFETLKAAGNDAPYGIWSNGATMLVSDHGDDRLYAYNMPPATNASTAPPRPVADTAAFDRNAAGDFPGLARSGNDLPVGIWSDWETVWVADETDDKLYAYDMKTKARVAGKDFDTLAAVGNNHLAGVWSDSDTMWVADYIDARVYAYHAESKARHIAEEFGGLKSAGNANPTGIWSDGATMWVADNVDKKIYAYNMRTKARAPEKEINTLNAAGNHHPRGLWSNGKTLWVADDSDDKVYAYDLTTKAQVPGKDFETLKAAGNDAPYGIWSNGATMLVSDHVDDRLYAYNMPPATNASTAPPRPVADTAAFDRNAAGDFPGLAGSGNDLPVGIWSDWETVWVADETDDKLYAYDMKTKARVAGKDFDTLAAVGNNHLAGVWSDSDTMWVADYIDARVYAYHAESKARHIAEEFGGLKSAGNANPTGIWSDGATMWVADNVDKKIYAYNMRTKARAPEKEINTLNAAGNHHPRGLWSNGKTLWVADDSDDKVYAYDLTTKAQVPGKDFETLKAAGNDAPYGIWSNGATMLVSDHGDDRLYAYNMPPATNASTAPPRPVADTAAFDRNAAGDFPGLARSGNDLPVGIWSDWETVWVADETDDKLYAYDMKTKARVAGKDFDTLAAVGNNHLAGVWSDSDTMWVADYIDARVYAYHAESKIQHIAEEFGGLKSVGNANPTGIWSDGATMWVADNVDKKIYAYNMRTKARAPEKEINTLNAAGNHHPRGLWSNGKTLWVADDSDDKVYAYDLTTKAQVPGKDFETLKAAGNDAPYGIWSNGATMLVSDHVDDRLYAYNMPPSLPVALPGMASIDSLSPGAGSLTVSWSAPSGNAAGITAYDLRHIRTDADEAVDANWTVEEDAWTTGSGALQYEITGLDGGAQYDVQVRAVSSAGYGPWSTTVTGTPEPTGPPPTSGASRTFSPVSVDPADELTVTITAPGSVTGQVVETLPPGFSYVSSSLSDSAVEVEGQIVTFTLLGEASFSYTVTASSVEGVYSFDGVLTPFGGEELPIGGDSTVTVGSAPMVYLSLDDSLPLMVRIGSPVPVIAAFTETVSDFTLDDITVLKGTVANFLADAEGIVYTFDVTPDAVAKVTVDIATGVAMDSEGNGNTAAVQLSFIPYDDDGVEGISKSEAIAAIRDYFNGNLDKAQAIAVIRLYFASGS